MTVNQEAPMRGDRQLTVSDRFDAGAFQVMLPARLVTRSIRPIKGRHLSAPQNKRTSMLKRISSLRCCTSCLCSRLCRPLGVHPPSTSVPASHLPAPRRSIRSNDRSFDLTPMLRSGGGAGGDMGAMTVAPWASLGGSGHPVDIMVRPNS